MRAQLTGDRIIFLIDVFLTFFDNFGHLRDNYALVMGFPQSLRLGTVGEPTGSKYA